MDVSETFRAGKQEVQLTLLPEARHLGLTLEDLLVLLGRRDREPAESPLCEANESV